MFREKKFENYVTANIMDNLPGRKPQPYISWKYKDEKNKNLFNSNYNGTNNKTYNLGVASNSRPFNPALDNPIIKSPIIDKFKDKHILKSKDKKDVKNANKFKPNPIKHWRKQLRPNQDFVTTTVTVRQAIDTPGGTSAVKLDCCNGDINANFIPEYIINNDVNKHCQKCHSIDEVLDKNGNVVFRETGKLKDSDLRRLRTIQQPKFDNERITRSASTIVKRDFYQSHSSYLRSRVKKFDQNQTIAPIKGIDYYVNSDEIPLEIRPATDDKSRTKPEGSQNYHSTSCNQFDCNIHDEIDLDSDSDSDSDRKNRHKKHNNNHPYQNVIYKPNNNPFQVQGAVESSLRTFNLQKDAINKNATFINPPFGTNSVNNSRYRGQNEAPITTKTFFQLFSPLNNHDCNVQIRNTQDSGRQLSGGVGRRTNCFFLASNKNQKKLGSTLEHALGPGNGILTRGSKSH